MASPSETPAATTSLASGVSKPWAAINSEDQNGLIAILTAFALGLILITISVRLYARHDFRGYRIDDYTFFAASAFAIAEAGAIFYALNRGLGVNRHLLKSNDYDAIRKTRYACDLLYIFILFLSKCSTGFLFLTLSPGRGHHRAIWATIAATSLWAITALFVEGIRCRAGHPWDDNTSTCTNSFARWAYIGVFDSLIEVALFSISIYIVWGVQMAIKSKAIVVGAFGCRLPNIAGTSLRLYYVHMVLNSDNAHIWSTRVVSCTQFAIGYSIMASVVPYLKPFMQAYERPEASQYHGSGSHSTYKLSALSSKASKTEGKNPPHPPNAPDTIDDEDHEKEQVARPEYHRAPVGRLRPERTKYQAKAVAVPDRGAEVKEDSCSEHSQQMIIKKGVEWSIRYDDNSVVDQRMSGGESSRQEGEASG